jgi:carbon-monoxide dehydrogenase medium subunit
MIPAEFDYEAPESLPDAIGLLSRGADRDAKLLAGGHSLIPLMKLRLATPGLLIDLRRVPGLHGIQREDGSWRIGAMTPHAELARNDELGITARVAGSIADQQVRNCGTVGGSLAHGDPASDLPAVLLACEGSVTAQGPTGQRSVAARELFRDYLQTAIEPDEVLTEVRVPTLEGWGWAYRKFNRRSEDWAVVAVTALVKRSGDRCEDVRVAMSNMGGVPLRAEGTEQALRGAALSADAIDAAAAQAADGTDPPADLNASAEYKRHIARVLCARALKEAAGQT